jgi:hypothetical protein
LQRDRSPILSPILDCRLIAHVIAHPIAHVHHFVMEVIAWFQRVAMTCGEA